ncbi:MAG: hypothetical protein HC862_16890 [Scytonema sp. RU_4_4]|nr:hypothetical protein [Scytonema sp. RU_4_4]
MKNAIKTVHSTQYTVTRRMVGDLNPPSGFATCSTWGNPKTAVAHHQRFPPIGVVFPPSDETDNW